MTIRPGPGGANIPPPPTPPPPPLALYVPETLLVAASFDQLTQIARLQAAFAERVAQLLAAAYADVLKIIDQCELNSDGAQT